MVPLVTPQIALRGSFSFAAANPLSYGSWLSSGVDRNQSGVRDQRRNSSADDDR